MQIGFIGFAVAFMAMVWYLTKLMSANGRNDDTSHGGGYGESRHD